MPRARVVVLLACLGLAGCPDNYGPDMPCNHTSDCESDLQCIEPASVKGDAGSCTTLNKRCTKACTTDSDCNYPAGGTCLLESCTDTTRYCLANGPL